MDPALDWLALDGDEEVLWADTPHPYSLVPALLVGIPLAVVLVGLFVVGAAYLAHRNTHYVVTTAALYRKTGVLSRSVKRIEFDKVQDTSYRQTFLGARFGFGTVDVSTAGSSGVEMSFENVADPLRLQSLINERIRGGDDGPRDGARDPAAVLDDILAELRAIRAAVGGDGTIASPADSGSREPGRGGGSAVEGTATETDGTRSDPDADRPGGGP